MTRTQAWLVGVGFVGIAAGVAAAGLCWLVATRPAALAHFIQQVL
jgi:hypothetical protein